MGALNWHCTLCKSWKEKLEDGLERTGMKSITQALMHICLSKTWGRLIGGYRSVETKNSTNNLGLSIVPEEKNQVSFEEN